MFISHDYIEYTIYAWIITHNFYFCVSCTFTQGRLNYPQQEHNSTLHII